MNVIMLISKWFIKKVYTGRFLRITGAKIDMDTSINEAHRAFFEAENETKNRQRQRDLFLHASRCFHRAALSSASQDASVSEALLVLVASSLRRADIAHSFSLLSHPAETSPEGHNHAVNVELHGPPGRLATLTTIPRDDVSNDGDCSALHALDRPATRISSQQINNVRSQ
jgi:hypothetical protein